jgi:hypothetical protein
MSTTGPTEQYDTPEQYDSGERRWEQPRFDPTESSVSGPVLPAVAWTGQPRTVVPPSAEESRLRMIAALIWPIALVIAITTGHWPLLLVGAFIVGGLLRRRLHYLRYQRMAVANTLR